MLNVGCNHDSFFTGILEDSIQEVTKSDHENFKTIVVFDCRGVELIDFNFGVRNITLDVGYQENKSTKAHYVLKG
jgi:hypothetical protein